MENADADLVNALLQCTRNANSMVVRVIIDELEVLDG